jgi:hypothetical protein
MGRKVSRGIEYTVVVTAGVISPGTIAAGVGD